MADAQARLRHAEELLAEPWIASAWARSLASERFGKEDRWIRDLRAVGWPPATLRDDEGREWIVGRVCEAHNCPRNQVTIIVDRERRRVYGMHETWKRDLTFFGEPDAKTRAWFPVARDRADAAN